jgi:hypothetical protein
MIQDSPLEPFITQQLQSGPYHRDVEMIQAYTCCMCVKGSWTALPRNYSLPPSSFNGENQRSHLM